MTLYLVRHGRAAAGVDHLDPGLDELGREQAEHAARALGSSGAERLVVSPLARTRQTAEPIARALDLAAEVRDEVAEVFDPKLPAGERRTMLGPLLSGSWTEQPAELRAFRQRVLDTLIDLGPGQVIVVSHFVAISAVIGAATGTDRVSPVPLPNASITTVEVEGGRFRLVRAGDTSHLPNSAVTSAHTALAGKR